MRTPLALLAILPLLREVVSHARDQLDDDDGHRHRYDSPKQCKTWCGEHKQLVDLMESETGVHAFCNALDPNLCTATSTVVITTQPPAVTDVVTSTGTVTSTVEKVTEITNINDVTSTAYIRVTSTFLKVETTIVTQTSTVQAVSTALVETDITSSTTSTETLSTMSTWTSTDHTWATTIIPTTVVDVTTITDWTTWTQWFTETETKTITAIETATSTETIPATTTTVTKRRWVETPPKLRRYSRDDLRKACRCLRAAVTTQTVTLPASTAVQTVGATITEVVTSSLPVTKNVDETIITTETDTDTVTVPITSTGTTAITSTSTSVQTSMSTNRVTATATVKETWTLTVTETVTDVEGTVTVPSTVHSTSATVTTATSTVPQVSTITSYTTTTSTSTSTTTTTSTAPSAAPTPCGANYIANGGFYDTLSGWTWLPVGNAQAQLSASDTDSGVALYLYTIGGSLSIAEISTTVTTSPGTTYLLEYKAKALAGTGVTFRCVANTNTWTGLSIDLGSDQNVWVTHPMLFTATAAQTIISCQLAATIAAGLDVGDFSVRSTSC